MDFALPFEDDEANGCRPPTHSGMLYVWLLEPLKQSDEAHIKPIFVLWFVSRVLSIRQWSSLAVEGTSVSGKAVALRLSSRQAPYRWKAVLDAVDTQWQAANLGFTAQDGMPPQGMVYGHIDRSQPLTDDWIPALARAISTGQPQPVTGTQLINGAPVRPQGRGSLLLHIPTERLGLHTGSQDDRLTLTLHTHPPDLNVAKSALKEANEEIDKLNNSKQVVPQDLQAKERLLATWCNKSATISSRTRAQEELRDHHRVSSSGVDATFEVQVRFASKTLTLVNSGHVSSAAQANRQPDAHLPYML